MVRARKRSSYTQTASDNGSTFGGIAQTTADVVGRAKRQSKTRETRGHGHLVVDPLLQYLSPLGWEHINLTDDYPWRNNAKVGAGKFRPLRPRPTLSVGFFPNSETTPTWRSDDSDPIVAYLAKLLINSDCS
jgi:hypothetical protein